MVLKTEYGWGRMTANKASVAVNRPSEKTMESSFEYLTKWETIENVNGRLIPTLEKTSDEPIKRRRVVPEANYTVELEIEDKGNVKQDDAYYLRVGQTNLRFAYASPIWVDA